LPEACRTNRQNKQGENPVHLPNSHFGLLRLRWSVFST
jgi:hypothetical protein